MEKKKRVLGQNPRKRICRRYAKLRKLLAGGQGPKVQLSGIGACRKSWALVRQAVQSHSVSSERHCLSKKNTSSFWNGA
jgi:hypothetical protein